MGHKGVSKRKPKMKSKLEVNDNSSISAQIANEHTLGNLPTAGMAKGRDTNISKGGLIPVQGSSKAHRKR